MNDINPFPIDTDLSAPVVEITPDPEKPNDEDSVLVTKTQQKIVTIFAKTIGTLKTEIASLVDVNESKQRQVDSLNQEIADNQRLIDEKQAEIDGYVTQARQKVNP